MLVKFLRWVLLAGLLFCQSASASELDRDRILVIYEVADLSPWIQMFNEPLAKGVNADSKVLLQLEFFEVTQYSDAEKLSYAKAIYEKSKKFPPDLVVGVLPDASNFVHEYLSVLAPNAEALYVLPGTQLREQLRQENRTNVVDSYWSQASAETRDLIEALFPNTQRLYYIVGTSEISASYMQRTRAAFDGWLEASDVQVLSGYTPQELRATFLSAPPNSVAMYTPVDHDRFGVRYTDAEILRQIENDVVPIFGIQDTLMGAGVIGGSFTSAGLYGASTARKAMEMLRREPEQVSDNSSGTLLAVDDKVMARFGLDHDDSPDGAIHINHEATLWEAYWEELLVGLTILLLQSILIALLFFEVRRRKRTEQAGEYQSRLFDSVINGITDAIVVANQKGQIVATNVPGFESTFSLKPGTVKGRKLRTLFGDEVSSEQPLSAIVSCRRENRFFPGETVIKHILDGDGKIIGYFAVVRDVSERLTKEEELKQAHKMEAVGNLAGGIAHDFNNILMAIVGNAELAADLSSTSAPQVELLERILTAADRARNLVKQIMSFSRVDEGDGIEAVNLGDLLDESTALIGTSFPSSIAIQTHVDPNLGIIEANPTQLQQIILNLCSNANHAMSGQGAIGITTENVEFLTRQLLSTTSMPPGKYVALRVSDSGTGIDEAHLPHIFDPFFTTKDRGHGTGMGLAMVYRIAESHDAFIDLQTGQNGSCFSIYFPAKDVVAVPDRVIPTDVEALPNGVHPRVMLVDDDEMVLRATAGGLSRMGCEVSAYADPVVALEDFQHSPEAYDLLVTDQVMPGLSGLQLINAIKTIRQLPALLCTGNADVSDLQGVAGVSLLRKPYTQAQLTSLIVTVILTAERDTLSLSDSE